MLCRTLSSYLNFLLFPFLIFAEEPARELCYGNLTEPLWYKSMGLEVSGEFLLLQPLEEGLAFAIRNDARQTSLGKDGTPGGPLIELEPDWGPAFRLSLGYVSNTTVRLTWMRFCANRQESAFTDTSLPGSGLQGIWMCATDPSVLYRFAHFNWQLNCNTLDAEIGKRYGVSPFLEFNPFCGARFAQIDQGYRALYAPAFGLSQREDIVHAMNDFRGIGPRFGVRFQWKFAHGWIIGAQGTASLLCSRFRTHYRFLTPTLPAAPLISDVDANLHRFAANGEIALSLGWGRCLANDRWRLGAGLGYEAQIFWGQNTLYQPLGSDAPALAIQQMHDLSIQGFSLRGECEF